MRRILGGWTELMVAAEDGDISKARQAIVRNPDSINKQNKEKQTALHIASASGYEVIASELLDRQADSLIQDQAGRTPLHAAAAAGHAKVIAALLGPRNKCLKTATAKTSLLTARDKDGCDALAVAVRANQPTAVHELLAHGSDPRISTDKNGTGPMHAAVAMGSLPLLDALVPYTGLETRDANGATPLHAAAVAGNLPVVMWLLQAGASTSTVDNKGQTAAEAALFVGQTAVHRAIRDAKRQSGSGGGAVPAPQGPSAPAPAPAGPQPPARPASPYAGGPGAPAAVQGQGKLGLQIPDQLPAAEKYPELPEGASRFY